MSDNSKISYEVLIDKYKRGDDSARNEICKRYQPRIENLANKIRNQDKPDVPLDDLISAGNYALLRAIDNFNENKNTKFTTFAYSWISGEINKYRTKEYKYNKPLIGQDTRMSELKDDDYDEDIVNENDIDIRSDANVEFIKRAKSLHKLDREIFFLWSGLGRDGKKYSYKDIASKFGMTTQQVARHINKADKFVKFLSLDKDKGEEIIRKEYRRARNTSLTNKVSTDKTTRWDRLYNITVLFKKYLPEQFDLTVRIIAERDDQFLTEISPTRAKCIVTISKDGIFHFRLEPDEEEIIKKFNRVKPTIMLLKEFLVSDDESSHLDTNQLYDVGLFPLRLNITDFMRKFAPLLTKSAMKEILVAMKLNDSTIRGYLNGKDMKFKQK